MKIIPLTQENLDAVCEIENACFANPWSKSSLAESLANPNSHFYVAELGGKIVGYMGLQIFSDEGYVTNVATLPEYRNQGIAKALIAECLKNKMEFITLEVRQSNTPAINLYKQFGFEPVGTRPKFYRNPCEDALLMTLNFEGNYEG